MNTHSPSSFRVKINAIKFKNVSSISNFFIQSNSKRFIKISSYKSYIINISCFTYTHINIPVRVSYICYILKASKMKLARVMNCL